jgi:hypothetical protein
MSRLTALRVDLLGLSRSWKFKNECVPVQKEGCALTEPGPRPRCKKKLKISVDASAQVY